MVSERSAIDLNADLGEGFPWDEPLLGLVSSASVSCGAHAGDPATIARTLDWAASRGVVVGAHPGYPDREGFGRRDRVATTAEVAAFLLDQCGWLDGLARRAGLTLRFVKPHGALYNQASRDETIAEGVVEAARSLGLPVLGLPGGCLETLARREGVRFVAEGFADRRYGADGRLVPRTETGAILTDPDEVAAQVLRLVGCVETLCIHGDDPRAVALAGRVRALLDHAGVTVRGLA